MSVAATSAGGYASGEDVRVRTSLRELAPYLAFTAVCYLVAPYLGLSSRDVDPRIAEVWPPGGVGFVLLTVVWYTGRRVVLTTLTLMLLVFAVTALLMGYGPLISLWMALVGVAQPLLMTAAYRRYLPHRGWAPETPKELAVLLFAAVGSSVALGLVGGFPTLHVEDLPSRVLAWWVLRNTVFCFVGGVTFMIMFYGRHSRVLPPSSWANRAGLLVTAVACVFGTYYDPLLPLSWLLIIPGVWGGLTLTVRGTAYLGITVALIAAAMTYIPQNQFGYGGVLPAACIVDLLVIASTAFTLLLALMREQRGALIRQLDRKGAESESQRRLLETVFDSMKDGVVLVEGTAVTMFNNAARQLLGRRMPDSTPDSWAAAFGLRNADGGPLDDADLRAGLSASPEGAHGPGVEVMTGQETSTRVLSMSATQLTSMDEDVHVILMHDITAERARLRELRDFAGMVAHDLRGPLTVMDGWLEVVQDADDEDLTVDALAKARDASKRMRQVIEDWLSYTVVQNGQLKPDAVKLADVAADIISSRSATWAEGVAPHFELALTHSVEADPALLRQLLDNLVGNAVKYTPEGQTPWVCLHSMEDAEPGWVRVEVVDHGMGVPEGEEQLIFEEFHRGPDEGRSAGTGLGLALTRRIVALHGGEISARRNPGPEGGSTFSFTVPEST